MQFVGGVTLAESLQHVAALTMQQKCGRHILPSIAEDARPPGWESMERARANSPLAGLDWPSTVAWLGLQLAEGLDYAHHKGVVHRDVKPANILLELDGTPKLADFNVSFCGLAGRAGAAAFFGGSLAYMSPEQLEVADPSCTQRQAADLDGRSDLFSLGVVLWETLHGTRSWSASGVPDSWSSALQLERRKRQEILPPERSDLKMANQVVLRIVEVAIRQCLHIDPAQRPPSGQHLAQQFSLALHPRAAQHLFPEYGAVLTTTRYLPSSLVLATAALLPNLAVAIFNFLYNSTQIVSVYPDLWPRFFRVAVAVNATLFPIGIVICLLLIRRYTQQIRPAGSEDSPKRTKFTGTATPRYWRLGHHIALVSGSLWLIAGLAFPIFLSAAQRSFEARHALHFFRHSSCVAE